MVGVWKVLSTVLVVFVLLAVIPTRNAWQRYEKRCLSAEARTNLSGIFTSMKGFGGEY